MRPESFFWRTIERGMLPTEAAALPGQWALFDTTPKPPAGDLVYEEDPLADLITELRAAGAIRRTDGVPDGSRVGISLLELDDLVFPRLAHGLGIGSSGNVQIWVPREIEHNFLGNLRYPMLGDGVVREWLADPVEEFDRLVAGFRLHTVDLYLASTRHATLGFRPLILFPAPIPAGPTRRSNKRE